MKPSALILFVCFFCVGCYNNAHLRTQRILEPGNTAISVSGAANIIGGYLPGARGYSLAETNILGLRSETSFLKGTGKAEFGPYFGFGTGADFFSDKFGIILGYDYRKYLGLDTPKPKKAGGQIEVNISPLGTTVFLRPTFTNATNNKRPAYYGVHGILASGRLEDYVYWRELGSGYDSPVKEALVPYGFFSNGAGITLGREIEVLGGFLAQIQTDLSLIQSSFKTDFSFPDNIDPTQWNYNKKIETLNYKDTYPLFSVSLGTNFFKPSTLKNKPLYPLPAPTPRDTTIAQLFYNPETGEPLKTDDIRFDPETGEKIKEATTKFDPETGKKIKNINRSFDIEKNKITEQQIIEMAEKNAHKKHISALWIVFGTSGLPASLFGALFGGVVFEEFLDGGFLPGFIGGGLVGLSLPSAVAKMSSRGARINYPSELTNKKEKEIYKLAYRKEVGFLRRNSAINGTSCSLVVFGFLILGAIAS